MRLLFIGPTYIGDAAISTGLLDHLLRQHPDARVTIACGAPAAPLFRAVPNLDRVVAFVKRGALGHWIDLWREFVGTYWDTIVDLRGSGLAWFLRAGQRHVFRPNRMLRHRTQALAATLGLDQLPAPVMWTAPEDEAQALSLIPPGPPVLALGPTGNWPPKIWPAERFADLARRLTSAHGPLPEGRIAVIAAAHERPIVTSLLATLPQERTIDLVGRLDLSGVCAALRRADFFVGNDSGPLYLAVACGVPVLGLFGPTPGLFGPAAGALVAPWAPRAAVARTTESATVVKDVPIGGAAGRALMEGLTVDMAHVAARALLDRLRGEAGPARAQG